MPQVQSPDPTFDQVVFAGGGNRCFWQAGFWHSVAPELALKPKRLASVSAGSAISCALFSGQFDSVLALSKEVMARNAKNRYWKNLFTEQPVHPHAMLYRQIILQSITAASLEQLKRGPDNRILLAKIPKWLGPKSATLVGISTYQLEKQLRHPVHPRSGRLLGFQSEFVPVRECQNPNALADLIISSSCTPPFTPLMYRHGQAVLDGGMVDNVPIHGIDTKAGPTLVLLTRPYKRLPQRNGVTYVQPSRPVAIHAWDYTSPDLLQHTYDQGRRDGLAFLQKGKE